MRLFIAQTIDGFIAGEGGALGHLEPFQGNDYGYEAHVASVGAVVVGRATLDAVFPTHGWPYPEGLPGVVMTSRPLPPGLPAHVRAETDPDAVAAAHPDAWIDGGGRTVRAFAGRGHLTGARIFTLPVLLGRGVRLFPDGAPGPGRWTLEEVRAHPCGTVEARWRVAPGLTSAARGSARG